MAVHWYPGHMAKATREIKQALAGIDVILEVVDARIPYSSANPVIAEFAVEKPRFVLLSKSDLADSQVTALWLDHLISSPNTQAVPCRRDHPAEIRAILNRIAQAAPTKANSPKPTSVMIMGIPNVGKSTIINTLAGRKIAKTGNEPAVTKAQQRIKLENNLVLYDTPGILWPRIDNVKSGLRLACTGAIRETAMEFDEAAFFLAEYLLEAYPQMLKQRYELDVAPQAPLELLEAIGAKRGKLKGGGRVDLNEVSKLFLVEFSSGAIGQISLETPDMMLKEEVEVEVERQKKLEKKAARKNNTRKK